jgi:hypothetical protein
MIGGVAEITAIREYTMAKCNDRRRNQVTLLVLAGVVLIGCSKQSSIGDEPLSNNKASSIRSSPYAPSARHPQLLEKLEELEITFTGDSTAEKLKRQVELGSEIDGAFSRDRGPFLDLLFDRNTPSPVRGIILNKFAASKNPADFDLLFPLTKLEPESPLVRAVLLDVLFRQSKFSDNPNALQQAQSYARLFVNDDSAQIDMAINRLLETGIVPDKELAEFIARNGVRGKRYSAMVDSASRIGNSSTLKTALDEEAEAITKMRNNLQTIKSKLQ